jgi:PAS domain S-box-containing protein
VVITLLVVIFATSAIAIFRLSLSRTLESTEKQMLVYINKLDDIISLTEKDSQPGFNHDDYIRLKPYFNQSAFFTADYPFLFDNSGTLLIHLYKEGQKFPREQLKIILSLPDKSGSIRFVEYKNNTKRNMVLYFKRVEAYNGFVAISVDTNEILSDLQTNRFVLIALFLVGCIGFLYTLRLMLKPLTAAIAKINSDIVLLAQGQIASKISYSRNDEVGKIVDSLNMLIDGLQRTTQFANEIGQNNLDTDFVPLGEKDLLGNSLLSMRESLKKASEENSKRQLDDERRNWVALGIAQFSDILRQNNNNLQTLSDNVTRNLINYLNACQGGLFILREADNREQFLELVSAFAFNRKKAKTKTIMIGEGLVGNCAVEKQTVYLKEIPDDYLEITSGLGDAPPRSILIVPLKLEDKIFGVIELASFQEFLPHEIEFVEKIGESIASTLAAVTNSIRTAQLLEQSQQQREEMAAQEEEMRQNMEEMQATQEEMARKTLEMEGMTAAINESLIFAELFDDGSLTMANPNFMSLTGYGKFDLEGKTINDFIHPADLPVFSKHWKEVKTGTPYKGTLRWLNRINEEVYVLCSISPAFDENGNLFKIFLLGQDITESKMIELKAQKQAEEIEQSLMELKIEQELSQQRDQEMASLLQALDSTCLLTEIDADGVITYINNKNVETLGDPKEKIEGRLHSEIDFQAKNSPQEYQRFWNELLSGFAKRREFSLQVKGRYVWISEHYTPVKDSSGKVIKIINIGIDITEGKEVEAKLKETINSLEKQLKK